VVKRENKIITLEENGRGGRGEENMWKREWKKEEGRCSRIGEIEKEEDERKGKSIREGKRKRGLRYMGKEAGREGRKGRKGGE
jgi:hypothetical protein